MSVNQSVNQSSNNRYNTIHNQADTHYHYGDYAQECETKASPQSYDNDVDFDDDDDDNDLWSDAEELDSIQNQYIDNNTTTDKQQKQEQEKQLQKCWICTFCEATNNLRLTLEQYNMHCGTCTQIAYRLKTPIIMSAIWDHPQRSNDGPSPQYWTCIHCTFHNTNMNSEACAICGKDKSKAIITRLSSQCPRCKWQNIANKTNLCPNCDYDLDAFFEENEPNKAEHQENHDNEEELVEDEQETVTDDIDDDDIDKGPSWQCPNCLFYTYAEDTCDKCQCHKPQRMIHWSPVEFCAFGYCRRNCVFFVPFVIKKLIEKYIDKVATYDVFRNVWKKCYKGFWKPLCLKCRLKDFYCKAAHRYRVAGRYIAKNMFCIYRWRFKLECNDSYVFVDSNNKKDAMIRKIKIGVYDILNNTFIGMGSFSELQWTQSTTKYCRALRHGDIITMELNMMDGTLGYAINDEWFGVYADIYTSRYRSEIYIYSEGVTVDNVELIKQCYGPYESESESESDEEIEEETEEEGEVDVSLFQHPMQCEHNVQQNQQFQDVPSLNNLIPIEKFFE